MSAPKTLGERMKEAEHKYRRKVPAGYLLLRLDGRAFHTYTRGLERPYDTPLMDAMDQTLLALCNEVQGVRFGYVESDEISLLVTDWKDIGTSFANPDGVQISQPWMGGIEAKILSLSAARASVAFNAIRDSQGFDITGQPDENGNGGALFDSRLWTFPATEEGRQEVANYFLWRQRDSVKNSVTMAALDVFGHKQILGMNTKEKLDALHKAKEPWIDLPQGFRNGRIAVREDKTDTVTYTDGRTGEQKNVIVLRKPFTISPAFDFSWERDRLLDFVPKALDG